MKTILSVSASVLIVFLVHQAACGWFGSHTVACQFGGFCLPTTICPSTTISLQPFQAIYSAYASIIATTSSPALTCIKQKLKHAPQTAIPLNTVTTLESRGLDIAAKTIQAMATIESSIINPAHSIAANIVKEADAINTALCPTPDPCHNASIKALNSIAQTCLDLTDAIKIQSDTAIDINIDIQTYAADLIDFSETLNLK